MEVRQVFKSLSKGWAVSLIFLLVIILSPSFLLAAEELKTGHQKLSYSVFAGGLHALEADLDINLSEEGQYHLELYAETHGILAKLAPWHGTFETHGRLNKKMRQAKPALHQSSTTWRDELEIKKYKYNEDGSFAAYLVQDEHDDGTKPRPIDMALASETTDILTATLKAMYQVTDSGECGGTSEVFDGKRRFEVTFKKQEEVYLERTKYNLYQGQACKCTVEVIPKGGKWHKKPRGWFAIQEQGREKGSMPTIWLAEIEPGEPAVPVKIRAKTSFGTFFLHLIHYKSTDQAIVLKE